MQSDILYMYRGKVFLGDKSDNYIELRTFSFYIEIFTFGETVFEFFGETLLVAVA